MKRWLMSAASVAMLGCQSGGPSGDAPIRHAATPRQAFHRDSAFQQAEDSMRATIRERRLGSAPVELTGPCLIAVYPWLERQQGGDVLERANSVRRFKARLPAARAIAEAAGLQYEQRYGPEVRLANSFNAIELRPSVGHGVGFVLAIPGVPPRPLIGEVADPVLAGAVAQYLAEAHAARAPPRLRS
jgi:hypothetical protein